MKKFFIVLAGLLLLPVGFFSTPRALADASVLDQSCIPSPFAESDIGGVDALQTFKPNQENITRVSVWLKGGGRYKIRIARHTTGENLFSFTQSGPGDSIGKWVDINFSAIPVEKGKLYAIHLQGIDGTIKWGYAWGDNPDLCYTSGTGMKDGLLISADWTFKIFGYTITPLEPEYEAEVPTLPGTTPAPDPETDTPAPTDTTGDTTQTSNQSSNNLTSPINSRNLISTVFGEIPSFPLWSIIALSILALALIGAIIWFLIDRKRKKKLPSATGTGTQQNNISKEN